MSWGNCSKDPYSVTGAGDEWHEFVVVLVTVCCPSMSPDLAMDSVATVVANNAIAAAQADANDAIATAPAAANEAPAAAIADAGTQEPRWDVLKPMYTFSVWRCASIALVSFVCSGSASKTRFTRVTDVVLQATVNLGRACFTADDMTASKKVCGMARRTPNAKWSHMAVVNRYI